jgi:hypothetical protein
MPFSFSDRGNDPHASPNALPVVCRLIRGLSSVIPPCGSVHGTPHGRRRRSWFWPSDSETHNASTRARFSRASPRAPALDTPAPITGDYGRLGRGLAALHGEKGSDRPREPCRTLPVPRTGWPQSGTLPPPSGGDNIHVRRLPSTIGKCIRPHRPAFSTNVKNGHSPATRATGRGPPDAFLSQQPVDNSEPK